MMPERRHCHYCNEPAEFLCDFSYADEDYGHRCDRPLCAKHRVTRGKHFDRQRSTQQELGSLDYCLEHAGVPVI
jgi:hypothetical protein